MAHNGNIFFISDTHFGHENTFTKFKKADGCTPLRPFSSIEEMNETMISNWNDVVKPNDKIYHLGDVVINRKYLPILERLNGKKRLIRGNHDIFPIKDYLKYFDEIYGVRVFSDMICSHIPLAKECISRFGINVHGHLHGNDIADGLYFNVSVEQINFIPIELSVLRNEIKKKKEKFPPSEKITFENKETAL